MMKHRSQTRRPFFASLARHGFVIAAFGSGLLLTPLAQGGEAKPAAQDEKVLRYALKTAETGFDPAKVQDLYSRIITQHIFEGLYTFDYLARPFRLKPLTAAALPEHSADFKTWTIRIKPGIYFAADPIFQGKQRELTAQDYVYSFKRFADPLTNSPTWDGLEEQHLLGLNEYRAEIEKSKKPFDYDKPIPGLLALDRYTLQLKLAEARPRLPQLLADGSLLGAVAREVIEAYGDKSMAHPVGTGPFKLGHWRRSSLIELVRNPDYRERFYDAEPNADDAEGQALLARFKGRRLPMLDRVEVAIIEENQPRWLSFLNGQFDLLYTLPEDFTSQAIPGGKLAPNLAKRGMHCYTVVASDVLFTVFNMEDPLLGGFEPGHIALRRAISLATQAEREIQIARRGQAISAQSIMLPHTTGYDAQFKSENGDFDPQRARALLDLYGYVDRNGDGWREQPDGSPLLLESLTTPDSFQRQVDEIWAKSLAQIGLLVKFKSAKWPENLKSLRAGKFQIWSLASSASSPDGQDALGFFYSPRIGGQNYARFNLPAMDKLYEQANAQADGPEREAVFREAKRLGVAYAPYRARGHRLITDIAQPWLIGYRRPQFALDWWQFVDVDNNQKP
ncbi:ABC-type transport system substrate-binding protein [Paucibacter oligotrophus]|uniref:ABC-type transport system substrate-binding protein n=1 Tax=Roseateles oligotrophus TaxID=1769250 RepID=A0A840L8L0_9BURK|nr:ABC transporter substrate-binding protein [Roseateles oligotrophus]MBB4842548.1 ABC-type transport system substrate-binding protein [Roseateles oligotrophus]